MWDEAAAMELDVEFPLLHIFYGRNRSNSSKKAVQTHENKPQILSDPSTGVSAA